MLRKHPILVFISIMILVSLACNAFASGGDEPPALELPPPIVTLQATAVTDDTLAPTATLPGGAPIDVTSAAPGNATVNILVDLNIRSGPGVVYDRLGFFTKGATVPVVGRDPASGWWVVQCPPHISAAQCWISGGPEYTTSNSADGVPIAQVPPTPTPPPTNTPVPETEVISSLDGGIVAYTDDAGLWVLPLDMGQNPPVADTPVQIVSDPNIEQLIIAPDGRSIAFVSQNNEGNSLHVVGVDGNGRSQLVTSSGLPVPEDDADVAVFIGQIAWLPNSRDIAFNTSLQNLVGPGIASQQDLWIASVNGEVTERFTAGQGGQTFAISPNGQQVIFGRPEEVVRANLDGSQVETVVTFDFVNTASEYAYAPMAQWLPDNSAALVAISSADPWQPEANASLFRIPRTGTAVPLGTILGNILFTPVNWTASGNNLVYVQMVPDGSNEQALTLAQGNGQNPQAYRVGEQLSLYAWSPNSAQFLYAGNGFFAIGRPGDAPLELATTAAATSMQWLNNNAFVLLNGSMGSWQLEAVNVEGETAVLANINTDFVASDVWVP